MQNILVKICIFRYYNGSFYILFYFIFKIQPLVRHTQRSMDWWALCTSDFICLPNTRRNTFYYLKLMEETVTQILSDFQDYRVRLLWLAPKSNSFQLRDPQGHLFIQLCSISMTTLKELDYYFKLTWRFIVLPLCSQRLPEWITIDFQSYF